MTNYDLMMATPPSGYVMTDKQQNFSKACSDLNDAAIDIESKFYDDMPTRDRLRLMKAADRLLTKAKDLADDAGLDSENHDEALSSLEDAIARLEDLLDLHTGQPQNCPSTLQSTI